MRKLNQIADKFKVSLASYDLLAELLVQVRACAIIHQSHHWRTFGEQYYSDHQLFMRLYDETYLEIDPLAEKLAGFGNTDLLGAVAQTQKIGEAVRMKCGDDNPDPRGMVEVSLSATQDLLESIKKTMEMIDSSEDELTRGLSNMLEGFADLHESHAYLLQQRLKG